VKKLPPTVFVTWSDDPEEKPILLAEQTAQDHADLMKNKIVGVYELVQTLEVRGLVDTRVVPTTKGKR
jgi:hypothetical protein